MCGVALMPGAHIQFQFWFVIFVPLLHGMIGLPSICWFWITPYFYPLIEHSNHVMQHYMLLATCAWLLVVGPKDDLFAWAYKMLLSDKNKVKNE